MASRLFSVDEVIASMQDLMAIPSPVEEDDEWSDDEFDGYIESDVEDGNEESGFAQSEMQDEGEREYDVDSEEGIHDISEQESGVPSYTHTPGCTQPPGDGSPLHFFGLLITDEMLDDIITQTRLYATQFIAAHTIGPRSRVQQWSRQEFSRDELKRFIALIIVMGLVNLPQIEDHWVTSWPYSSQTCSKVHRQ